MFEKRGFGAGGGGSSFAPMGRKTGMTDACVMRTSNLTHSSLTVVAVGPGVCGQTRKYTKVEPRCLATNLRSTLPYCTSILVRRHGLIE
jgi:ribosomal protein L3